MEKRCFLPVVGALFFFAFEPGAAVAETWETIGQLFAERCTHCHSGEYAPLGLGLDSHEGAMRGSQNGPVVLVDTPDDSPLLHRVLGLAEPRMPLDGPPFLNESEIASIRAWIAAGAPGPTEASSVPAPQMPPPDPYEDGQVTYDEVAAIFGRHCIECHSANSRMEAPPEGVRLDSYDHILTGGDRAVVLPGNPQASEIMRRVLGLATPRMPFDGPPWLAEDEISLLRAWIKGGARSAEGVVAPLPVGARVRLRGVLTGPSEIDGATFVMTGSTRIDDRPQIGMRAELRGRVGANGEIIAERLRER